MIKNFPVLKTDRLILREIRLSDAAEVFAIRSHKINLQYTGRPAPKTIDDAIAHINLVLDGMENKGWISWTLTKNDVDKAMGFIGYWNVNKAGDEADIGYELHPDFVGKGFMSEAAEAVFNYGLKTMKLNKILAHLHQDNKRSLNLLKRFGFQLDESFVDKEEPEMVMWELCS